MGQSAETQMGDPQVVVVADSGWPEHAHWIDAALIRGDLQVIRHVSGAPWIVGHWASCAVQTFETADGRLVLFGLDAMVDVALVSHLALASRNMDCLTSVLEGIHGPAVLVAESNGRAAVQGDLAGIAPLYYTHAAGQTVAGTSISMLLDLCNDDTIDRVHMASQMLAPLAPWPLAHRSPWSAIEQLCPLDRLKLGTDGSATTVRWWRPPDGRLSLDDAAAGLRTAIRRSCQVRADSGHLSADLSGGIDSTALCFGLDSVGADVTTFHVRPSDESNTDYLWAERAQMDLPRFRHRCLEAGRPESMFTTGLQHANSGCTARPDSWVTGRAHVRDLAGRAIENGSTLHICGLGGDELFGMLPAYPWSFARSCSVKQLRALNNYRLGLRVGPLSFVQALATRTSYRQHLAKLAGDLQVGQPQQRRLDVSWTGQPWLPGWATGEALSLARSALELAAAGVDDGLDADRTRHQLIQSLMFEGSVVHQVNQWLADVPIRWSAPFLDRQVIEAVLSVRTAEWFVPRRPKSLLLKSLRGIVPSWLSDRWDKGEYSREAYSSLRAIGPKNDLSAGGSRLSQLGLIDEARLHSALDSPDQSEGALVAFDRTVAAEVWLRENRWAS